MKKRDIIFPILICLLTIGHISGQTMLPECYIHTVKSQNGKYFLKTIPFDNIEETTTGKTIVYNSDSTKFYEIDRHFELANNRKELFLSNDGKTIVYLIDREFTSDGVYNKSIQIFKNGIAEKQFQMTDLFYCDSDKEDCYLLYKKPKEDVVWENGRGNITFKIIPSGLEKYFGDNASFINNDTLYIFTKPAKLITVDLINSNLISLPVSNVNTNYFKESNSFHTEAIKFKFSSNNQLPVLISGMTFDKGLANMLHMKIFPEDKKRSNTFKKYSLYLQILVDKNGNAILNKIQNYNSLPEDRIAQFLSSQKFDTSTIPVEAEKWLYSGWISLMNKSKKIATKEKNQDIIIQRKAFEHNIVADSINGIYIPKNLEECFTELNRILKAKDIEKIKNLSDRSETIQFHIGFGTWLRNNWGLWGGSRLQQYFIAKGIVNAEHMSSTILQFYYDWLNNHNNEWKEFVAK